MTTEKITLNENNTFEITDEVLAIMEAQLCEDVEEKEEDFDFSFFTKDYQISAEELAEIERKEEEEEMKRKFKWAGVAYDAKKKYKKCPRCCGQGTLDCYAHVSNGICFKCGGAKYIPV